MVLLIAVVLVFAVRAAYVNTYGIPSGSMQPALDIGDRIEIDPDAYAVEDVQRGDVVVFDSTGSFAPYRSRGSVQRFVDDALQDLGLRSDPHAMVKRVIGIGGDTVECCSADGQLRLNGEPLEEPYLAEPAPPGRASLDRFTVTVPDGRVFLLGDNRHASEDSRALLGSPGGGMIPESKIRGRYLDTR
ncbi:MAG: signal peptidase I [Micrococcaceae bacterium]